MVSEISSQGSDRPGRKAVKTLAFYGPDKQLNQVITAQVGLDKLAGPRADGIATVGNTSKSGSSPLTVPPSGKRKAGRSCLWIPGFFCCFLIINVLKDSFLFYVNRCFAYMYVCVPCTCLILENARKSHWIPWNRS